MRVSKSNLVYDWLRQSIFYHDQLVVQSREDGVPGRSRAGLCCAVDLPPAEARADLAGLMVRDPRFQELRENEV